MTCMLCPEGQMVGGAKSTMLEREHTILIVRNVPAQVCDTCGEPLFSGEVVTQLEHLMRAAQKSGAELSIPEPRGARPGALLSGG